MKPEDFFEDYADFERFVSDYFLTFSKQPNKTILEILLIRKILPSVTDYGRDENRICDPSNNHYIVSLKNPFKRKRQTFKDDTPYNKIKWELLNEIFKLKEK